MNYLLRYKDFFAMCKLKVVYLLLLTALVGMLLARPEVPSLWLIILALFGIGCSSSSAAVINHIIDRDIDKDMQRTKNRPFPKNRVSIKEAIVFSTILGSIGLLVLYFFVNSLTALLTFLSLIGYAVIYSKYLKHMTPQNIVIGGTAGATPPILGWTTVTNSVEPFSLILFLIIFLWTPPHFWALAIDRVEDYSKTKIPMLPVSHGIHYTKIYILLYTILLFLISLFPYLVGMSYLIYLIGAIILGIIFLFHAIMMLVKTEDKKRPLQTFSFSIAYLVLICLFLLVDHYIIVEWENIL